MNPDKMVKGLLVAVAAVIVILGFVIASGAEALDVPVTEMKVRHLLLVIALSALVFRS